MSYKEADAQADENLRGGGLFCVEWQQKVYKFADYWKAAGIGAEIKNGIDNGSG